MARGALWKPSAVEVATRIVGTLLDLADDRARMVDQLGAVVRLAVEELDPDHERDTRPTWWQDRNPWARMDPLDRLRFGFDQIQVLEAQAGVVVNDLRGMLALRPVGSLERPIGYTPARAHTELLAMGRRRRQEFARMNLAERRLRANLTRATAGHIRGYVRDFEKQEAESEAAHARLSALLGEQTGRQAS